MTRHRCTGFLLALLFFVVNGTLSGQPAEQFLDQEDYVAAAEAFARRRTRADDFRAGEAWLKAYEYDKARLAFEQVLRQGAGPDSLGALAQHKIGVAYYNGYADSMAMEAYRKAVSLTDEVFAGDRRERAHSRLNLGQILLSFGQADTAMVLIREATDIFSRAHPTDTLNWIRGLNSTVSYAEDTRDYQLGTDAAGRAIDLMEQMKTLGPYDAYDTWYTAGSAYLVFHDLTSAARAALNARRFAEQTGEKLMVVQALKLLGGVSRKEGDDQRSLEYHLAALEIGRETEITDEERGLSHFNVALQYDNLGRYGLALEHQELATPLLAGHPLFHPRSYSLRGNIFLKQERWAEAREALNTGVALLTDGNVSGLAYPDPTTLTPAQLEVLADLLGDRAEALARSGNPEAARKDYDLLFAVQDDLRRRVTSDASRNYLSRNLRRFFDRAINLEYTRYQQTTDAESAWRAIALSERARAYSLLTAVQRNRNGMPAREVALRARIARLERDATAGSSAAKRLTAARLELDRLVTLNEQPADRTIPDFDREQIVRLLNQKATTMVSYHMGDSSAYRFVVTPDGGITWSDLGKPAEMTRLVGDWKNALLQGAYKRKSLKTTTEQSKLDEVFLTTGLELRKRLVPDGIADGRRLCLLPDGPLNVLPFGALPAQSAALPLDYRSMCYLNGQVSLHYAYSARVWQELEVPTEIDYSCDIIAFAPEFRGGQAREATVRAARLRAGERAMSALAPLRFNTPEVREVAGLLRDARVYTGENADRQTFLAELGNARILHLSTHGVVNLNNPELSFIAFSQLGDSLEYDEMLFYNDLSGLPVRAELAVLSACETNLGAYVPGETSLSLASAFTAAGAKSTLTSLWQVDDAATKDLMVRFYQELTEGADRSEALRRALLAHQRSDDYAHPYYWSAMTLYGDAGPLDLQVGSWYLGWPLYVLLAMFAVGAGVLLSRRRR